MMKKMVEQWNLEIRGCLDTSSFKGKSTGQTEKPRGKTKGHEEKRKLRAGGMQHSCESTTTGRAQNLGQPRGGSCPVLSLFRFVALSFALPSPWYLLCYTRVDSFFGLFSFLL